MTQRRFNVLLALILILVFFIITGCTKKTTSEQAEIKTGSTSILSDTQDSETKEAEAPTSADSMSISESLLFEDLSALELSKLMGNGINLGNTMEAYGHEHLGTNAATEDYETFWGQPVTTKEMIQGMKDSGFDSIRIPVAWTNMMAYEDGDYTINEAYLKRVEEIIGYAMDADMIVIINDHWDGGWWGMFGSATEATRNAAMDLYIAMWTQIGNHFAGYSDMLIFESANEELGNRLNDADVAVDSGTLSSDDCYEMTNKINQVFVDTIRGLGGNNEQRFLLIAGYNTDFEMTLDDRYQMPKDTAKDKLLLSVHYYTPWSYCGTDSVTTWGSTKHYETQNELFERLTKYTDQGYGIVIGEFAVLTTSNGDIKEDTDDFVKNVLDNCDLYNYVPMLWDTNAFYIRENQEIRHEGLKSLYAARSNVARSALNDEDIINSAITSMAASLEEAKFYDANITGPVYDGNGSYAWIMFNSNDYNATYSVGDIYDPTSITSGVKATDVEITGPGTYTVGLDFTGTTAGFANSIAFSALGIASGELLYPGYLITIREVLINGEAYKLKGVPYTSSDDEQCTRVNLFNGWVNEIPEEARYINPNMKSFLTPTPLDPTELTHIETFEITFDYLARD